MATISLGNFGKSTPGRSPVINAPNMGQTAAGIERLGAVGVQAGVQMRADQSRYEDEDRRRQEAQAEMAARAQEAGALGDAEIALNDHAQDVGSRVLNGTLPRDQAEQEFLSKARESIDGAAPQFRDANRPLVQSRLEKQAARLNLGVRKAVEQRDRQDVTAAIDKSLEHFERLYQTEPKKADIMARELIDQMGPWSTLTPDQLAKKGQAWAERTRFTKAYGMVNAARRDNAALDRVATQLGAEEFDAIDPQRKAQLLTTLEGYRVSNTQRAESEARRREAEQERALRRAESAFNGAQAIMTQGKVLSPEYVDQVAKATAGTPFGAAFKESLGQGPANAAFGAQPLRAQAQMIQQERARLNAAGTNPAAEKRIAELERIHQAAVKDYAADPLVAAAERGVIERVNPIPLTDITKLPQVIGERVQQAQIVSQQTGKPTSPLVAAEADKVGEMLQNLPAPDRAKMISQITAVTGPQTAAALAGQLDKKDRALALAFGAGDPVLSDLILRGQQAKKDGTSTKGEKVPDVKAAAWRARAAAALEGVFPTTNLTGAYVDAAELAMHALAAEQGGRLREKDMERAIGLAIGGTLIEDRGQTVERGGRKQRLPLPVPAGVTEDALDARLKAVTRDELLRQAPGGKVRYGGNDVTLDEFIQALPKAELAYLGPGRYGVMRQGRYVTNEAGKPIVIGLQ